MPDIDLARIAPVTDAEAARLASATAFAELSRQISAQPYPAGGPARQPAGQPAARRRGARPWTRRRALLAGLPLAALAGAAALVVALLPVARGGSGGNGSNSPAAIQALSFTKAEGRITVVIKNLYADTAWYNADLARHHLDITLSLVPASPSIVGSVIEENYAPGIKLITSPKRCYIASEGAMGPCVIGFSVPASLRDPAGFVFGRPARPGEHYDSTGSIFAPGEALAGLLHQVAGQPLSKVRPILASHHLTVAVARDASNHDVSPGSVPGDYYLTNIFPWAPGQVMIWTGPRQAWQGSEPVKLPGNG